MAQELRTCGKPRSASPSFRKSVATLIDREVGIEAAQAQLGHDDSDITRDFCVHKFGGS